MSFHQLKKKLGEKFIQRIGKHRGPLQPPFKLQYRQIFILPSGFGASFSLLVFVMTMAALNFNNNLALLLSYLLLAVILFSSILAYRNLVGIRINPASAEPVFAGETAIFSIPLRSEIGTRPVLEYWQETLQGRISLRPNTNSHLLIRKQATMRGRLELGPWKIQTRWPYGYFRAWAWVLPSEYCLVYPTPSRNPPKLPLSGSQGQQVKSELSGDEELHGLRDYRPGEPLNRIAWRSSARADKLISRESEQSLGAEVSLRWDALGSVSLEERLSILCAWALEAEAKGLLWSMDIPDYQLPKSSGQSHLHSALRQLALFDSSD